MAVWQERATLLFTEQGIEKLRKAHVLIVGMGGVGSFVAEFLVRAGIGKLTIVDGDAIDVTNINRQLPALHSTVGVSKVVLMGQRLKDINPDLELHCIEEFLSPERAFEIVTKEFNFVVDAIDSVTPKLNLIIAAKKNKVKVISNMGAGGKMDASKIFIKDIQKTEVCPLAKQIRKRLRKQGISSGVMAVYSTEHPVAESLKMTDGLNYKKSFFGTNSWMPAAFGLRSAQYVVTYLLSKE